MNCELCQTEMHTWRNNGDAANFQPLLLHVSSCPGCAERFRRITDLDERLRRTVQACPIPHNLDRRIFIGLQRERSQAQFKRRRWLYWLLVPMVTSVIAFLALGWIPRFQENKLREELGVLLSQPPPTQVTTTNRDELLNWSAGILHSSPELPPELSRVQFRGATAMELAHHKAVLLKMKNEQRASLLIVDGRLEKHSGFTFIAAAAGNASIWSDSRRTYVLLFKGNREEMQKYMVKMGIATDSLASEKYFHQWEYFM